MSQEKGKIYPYVAGFWEEKYDDLKYQLTVTEENDWYDYIDRKMEGQPTEKVISYLLFLLTDTVYGAGKHQDLRIPQKMILALREGRHDEQTMEELGKESAHSFFDFDLDKEMKERNTLKMIHYATSFFLPSYSCKSYNICVLWCLLPAKYPQNLGAERNRLIDELYYKTWEQTKQDKERIHKALHGNLLALHPYMLERRKYVEDKVKEILNDGSMNPQEHLDTMLERATPEQLRRFLLAILSDEKHGALRHASAGSLSHFAISNVIALLNDNCKDPKIWEEASGYAIRATHCIGKSSSAVREALSAYKAATSVRAELWEASGGAKQAKVFAAGESAQWAAKAAGESHYAWMADTLIQILKQAT